MPGRINEVGAGADYGDRARPAVESALMRGAVDAEREAGDDRETGVGQMTGEACRVGKALRCSVAAADDGDAVRVQQRHAAFYI